MLKLNLRIAIFVMCLNYQTKAKLSNSHKINDH
jgi:hypothetical protein